VSCVPCPKRTVPVFRPSAPLPGRLCFAVLFFVQLIASVARAQSTGAEPEPAPRAAAIFGRVIDARDESPVPFARLYLESTSGSEDMRASRNGSAMNFRASRTVVSDADGTYSLGGLEPGTYRLHVPHPGFAMS
jgi:protocatechuate 3,4-dioxygenase beta subunit